MKIRIENLPLNMTAAELKELFSPYGDVNAAEISLNTDDTVTSLTGLVEMSHNQGANALKEVFDFRYRSFHFNARNVYEVPKFRIHRESTVVVSLFSPSRPIP